MIMFITQKQLQDSHYSKLDGLETTYIDFFNSYGVLIPIPNKLVQVARLLRTKPFPSPDLIILTGGNNINPKSVGSKAELDDLAPNRDKVEYMLLDYALNTDTPVIGICRGFHFINVFLEGALTFNLLDHPVGLSHLCRFEGKDYKVNSYHDHGIMPYNLSGKLQAIVYADHGLVEAYTHKNKKVLGIQWHPERFGCEGQLFELLVKRYLNI